MLKAYLKEIFAINIRGDAREESFYSPLKDLIEKWAHSSSKRNIEITTLPKKTEAGNPDFRVWDGALHIVGYIEAKAPSEENLDQIETTEQLKRYRSTFPNLILTNFFEFRLYRNGSIIDRVQIGRPFVMHKLKTVPPVEKQKEFYELLSKFFSFSFPAINEAKALAKELAKRTRFLRDVVLQELINEGNKELTGFYEAFKEYLISGLTIEDFADLYSQTITYGLFAARIRSENGFSRRLAYESIPHTIGILRDVFKFICLGDIPKQMEWIIDDISEVLAVTDAKKILHQYFHEGKGSDPVIHFYETFLSEYDPETREKRGVYYTPEPVVSYIVRSLNKILKKHFGKSDGFADSSVTVLDPAAGTLTFIAEATKLAINEFISKYGSGGKENFIREHILKNFYAFELMMAPYAVGHLKMSFLLEEMGYKLKENERFKFYLTNTLEMEQLPETKLPGMSSLSEESHLALDVKKKTPILVILGNPPYSGHSANMKPEMVDFLKQDIDGLQSYYKVDEKPLGEKNPKNLQDDYVKFIRFAQWKIDNAGEGVLGFITNHSYLDNPTFRGMRQSLMKTFNEIYIVDLHGNSRRKEKCPDSSKDENVFDIQQGVAIAFFIKKKNYEGCRIYHSELWGLRERKHKWLLCNNIETTEWRQIFPKSEFYLFIQKYEKLLKQYLNFYQITDLFLIKRVGIDTGRDRLTIQHTKDEIWTTVLNFSKFDIEIARKAYKLGEDTKEWKIEWAQKDIIENILDKNKIVSILYRPFDIRYTYYTGRTRGFHSRPRLEVMRYMIRNNLGLITSRQMDKSGILPVYVTTSIIDSHSITSSVSKSYLFPLYLYHDDKKLLNEQSTQEKISNIKPNIFSSLTKFYKEEPSAESIFYYIYAVLYSNIYRTRYAEFLRVDFPRIPFTQNYEVFKKMAELGQRIVSLHLLESSELNPPLAKFQGEGDNRVEKVRYESGRVFINQTQYFKEVEPQVWQYQIGGYQVCDKWLKDRKGRILNLEEIKHYCRVVTALKKTIEIQALIDKVYPELEKEFNLNIC